MIWQPSWSDRARTQGATRIALCLVFMTAAGSGVAAETSPVAPAAAEDGQQRIDTVKSVVSAALAASSQSESQAASERGEEATPAPASIDSRRQWLKELVGTIPVPDQVRNTDYVGELEKEVSATLVVREAAPPNQEASALAPSPTVPSNPPPGMYQVRAGDSLWTIAQSQLGDGFKWTLIYRANRAALKNVDILHAGQMLVIPAH